MKLPNYAGMARRVAGRLRPAANRPQTGTPSRNGRHPARRTRPQVEYLEDRSCPSTVTLNYLDSGWWDSSGFHDSTNKNYVAGFINGAIPHEDRDFFVFDLSAVNQPIVGAQLRLFNPPNGYSSPDPTQTYALFDVSTPITALRASGSGQTAIFADLGSGMGFGSQVVSPADNNRIVSIDLNETALVDLNGSRGGLFALGGAVTTIHGLAEQSIFGTSGSSSDTRQLVLTVADAAGPVVVGSTPAGNTFGTVSNVRVTFDRPIDVSTFDTTQVVSFTRTVGTTVTDLSSAVTDVTPVTGSGGRQFDVSFTPQTALGNYSLVIGPNITDLDGNAMDQNLNGITGEPGLPPDGDEYAAHFTIQGPRITASTPTTNTSLPGTLSSLQVTFNEPVNPATFTPGGVVLVTPGGQQIAVSGVTPVAGSGNTRFNVTFAPLTTTGFYQLLVLPYVEDANGNRLDQNGNLIGGEIPGDIYSATFGIAGPRITSPTTQVNFLGPATSVRVTFNEPIDVSSFTPDQIASFTDASGNAVPVYGVLPVAGSNFTQFDVFFPPQTTTGFYTMVIGPDIRDVYGNAMDQNGNDLPGEPGPAPGDDQFTLRFTVPGPRVTSASSLGTFVAGLTSVRVSFSGPMNPATFTPSQIASFTDPSGNPVAVTGVTAVPFTNNTQFDIHFVPAGNVGTGYSLVIGPNILDVYGNAMDQNGNFTTGELGVAPAGDQFRVTFNITGPVVTAVTPSGSVRPPVGHAVVTFNEPINPLTFTPTQVALTGPGGPVGVTSVTPVTGSDNTQFTVTFDNQTDPGAYTLVVGPGIRDYFGNSVPLFTDHFSLTNDVVLNAGFETGDLTGWDTTGSAAVRTSSFGTGPTEGTYDALITNDGGPSHTAVESFLGLANNALAGLVSNVTNGSAIRQTITVTAGMTLTFDWNFLTNESVGGTTYRDFAFVSLTPVGAGGTLVKLADTTSELVVAPSATGFSHMTGFHTFTFMFTADGTYVLGVGAMNAGDTGTNSALLVDNFQVSAGGGGGGGATAVGVGSGTAGNGAPRPPADANLVAALTGLSADLPIPAPATTAAVASRAAANVGAAGPSAPATDVPRQDDRVWAAFASRGAGEDPLLALAGAADAFWADPGARTQTL